MGHISDRADKFASRLVKREPVDMRSTDEKLADFHKQYNPREAIRSARRKVKQQRERTNGY